MTLMRMDVPIGTVLDYAGSTVPTGYLECDGSAVSRTTYPLLYAAIGTTWGAGDGSTTFNLPNLGGRACIGKGSRNVGNTGGSETHTLTSDEMPSHCHNGIQYQSNDVSYNPVSLNNPTEVNTGGGYGYKLNYVGTADKKTRFNPELCTALAGGGVAHSIMQPYAVVKKIIRAA
jgi:microcystin-dependent protein